MVTRMSTVIIQTDKGVYKGMSERPLSAQKFNRTIEVPSSGKTAVDDSDDEFEGHATPGPLPYGCDSEDDVKLSTSPQPLRKGTKKQSSASPFNAHNMPF